MTINTCRSSLRSLILNLLAAAFVLCVLPSAMQAQDETTGWPGFNAENTVRGTVLTSGPNTFTMRTDDGITYRVLYSMNSRFIADRGPARSTDIHIGDMLIATGNLDTKAKSVGAAVLIGVSAEEVRKAREGLGKTWTAGKITAVSISDNPRITLSRLDGVPQTIGVDENTSFKRHHESITMADIKTGEGLRADGHLVGKTFLAATINVFTPGKDGDLPPGSDGSSSSGREHP